MAVRLTVSALGRVIEHAETLHVLLVDRLQEKVFSVIYFLRGACTLDSVLVSWFVDSCVS